MPRAERVLHTSSSVPLHGDQVPNANSRNSFSELFLAFLIFAAVMVWVFHRITTTERRGSQPRDQRQVAGHQGSNSYDASSHTTFTNHGEINVNSPAPSSDE